MNTSEKFEPLRAKLNDYFNLLAHRDDVDGVCVCLIISAKGETETSIDGSGNLSREDLTVASEHLVMIREREFGEARQ